MARLQDITHVQEDEIESADVRRDHRRVCVVIDRDKRL
jgi:hypothetical protein